jgi:hypothetical protein
VNSFSQEFEGEPFYGLDDFLEKSTKKSPTPTPFASFDWFGLDG